MTGCPSLSSPAMAALAVPKKDFGIAGRSMNPMANVIMLVLFVIPSLLTILTGFAMLAEVTGHDSWQYFWFGWMVSIFGNTLDLHLLHRLSMWALMCFVMAHVYMAVREDVVGRQTMISTMLSGVRLYRK